MEPPRNMSCKWSVSPDCGWFCLTLILELAMSLSQVLYDFFSQEASWCGYWRKWSRPGGLSYNFHPWWVSQDRLWYTPVMSMALTDPGVQWLLLQLRTGVLQKLWVLKWTVLSDEALLELARVEIWVLIALMSGSLPLTEQNFLNGAVWSAWQLVGVWHEAVKNNCSAVFPPCRLRASWKEPPSG